MKSNAVLIILSEQPQINDFLFLPVIKSVQVNSNIKDQTNTIVGKE